MTSDSQVTILLYTDVTGSCGGSWSILYYQVPVGEESCQQGRGAQLTEILFGLPTQELNPAVPRSWQTSSTNGHSSQWVVPTQLHKTVENYETHFSTGSWTPSLMVVKMKVSAPSMQPFKYTRGSRHAEFGEGCKETVKNSWDFFEPQFSQQPTVMKWFSCGVILRIKMIYVKYLIMCQAQGS